MSDDEDLGQASFVFSDNDDNEDDDFDETSDLKVKPKKTSKSSKPKKNSDDEMDVADLPVKKSSPKKSKKRPEAADFRKLDHIEHALKRPDMYIGNITKIKLEMWVYDEVIGMNFREIEYVPGLYKIFDEIVVNAADNFQRDPDMKYIKVEIDTTNGTISVQNDGHGIPVEIHPKERVYVPSMIFGQLLTGNNFDDTIKKLTGGRNGLGAKLTNIFSKQFTVETVDQANGKIFKQTWKDNLSKTEDPIIKSMKSKSYTKVTFKPDLERFGMTALDKDIVALMTKRVYDLAGCNPKLKVSLNDKVLPIKDFKQYCELYVKDPNKPKIFEKVSDRWSLLVSVTDGDDFQQVSFVNSICTLNGGTHVTDITKKLCTAIGNSPAVKKFVKSGVNITPARIKKHLWVFVNCLIENPGFDAQLKDNLITPVKDFGSKCELSEKFYKQLLKCGVVEAVLEDAKRRGQKELGKTGGKKGRRTRMGITKLDDANDAGGRYSNECTLILTEGDSAKALAVGGLGVVGRDKYGAFPLRGKLLNVRDAAHKRLMSNEEISNLMKIIGLQIGTHYESTKELRYGHLMIMTDQDTDGSHIKGLIINFIYHFWPELLQRSDFVTEFITPIVKARKGKQELSFFTLPEYQEWKRQTDEDGEKGWKIKYYKGLGTSTPTEAKEYFADIERHQLNFSRASDEDGKLLEMAFSKSQADNRKEWMAQYKPGTFLDQSQKEISYSDFINKELILYSIDDCARSIPSLVDGLKPGQRKILYCCFLKKLKTELKVAQLSGYVSEKSAYHHGEQSLQQTIVGMAQNFVGNNNINLLEPIGQFGTRLQGGKDAASARYIFTSLNKLTRALFHEEDDNILKYLDDDGLSIEPEWYIPILPMVLVNGAMGIGTGWSTTIPNYNPKNIVANLKHLLNDEPTEPMHPWYRGFKGTVKFNEKKQNYIITGVYEKIDDDKLEITELPIGVWTQNYKEYLETLLEAGEKQKEEKKKEEKKKEEKKGKKSKKEGEENEEKPKKSKKAKKDDDEDEEKEQKVEKPKKGKKKVKGPLVKDYKEYHTDATVKFVVEFHPGKLQELEEAGELENEMWLSVPLSINNMVLFDAEGRIRKYANVDDIIKEFFSLRLRFYEKRKDYLINELNEQWSMLDNKVRFLLAVIKEEIVVRNRKKADLLNELAAKKFAPFYKKKKEKQTVPGEEAEGSGEEEEEPKGDKARGYDYLLSMPLWNLTMEKVQQLMKQREEKQKELRILIDTPIKTLWERDLDTFMESYDIWVEQEAVKASQTVKPKRGKKAASKKRRTTDDDDSDVDFSSKPKSSKRAAISKDTTKVSMKPKQEPKPPLKQEAEKPKVEAPLKSLKEDKSSKSTLLDTKPKDTLLDKFVIRPSSSQSKTATKPEETLAAKKPTPMEIEKPKPVAPKKSATSSAVITLDDDEDSPEKPTKKPTKKQESDSEDDYEKSDPIPTKKPTTVSTRPTRQAAAVTKKPKYVESDDEEEEEEESEESGEAMNSSLYDKDDE